MAESVESRGLSALSTSLWTASWLSGGGSNWEDSGIARMSI